MSAEPYIVIVTCKTYEKHLHEVLETVKQFNKIIIVTANSDKDSYEIVNNVIHVNIVKNLYEYTGWLGVDFLVRNNVVDSKDWFLMTHDTTKFTHDSGLRLSIVIKMLHKTPIDFYSLVGGGFHNIALCRNSGIHKIADHFHTIDTMTKQQAINIETKLPDFLDSNVVGEYVVHPHTLGYIEGRNATFFESCALIKFFM